MPTNRTMSPAHQPVVQSHSYSLDLEAGSDGLAAGESERLTAWLAAIRARYGDILAIAGPPEARSQIASAAAPFGVDPAAETVPESTIGKPVRVTITRVSATVSGCPDWSAHSDANFANALSPNYACATNANLAAMVADPDHLRHGVRGAEIIPTDAASKAIAAYRKKEPTGSDALARNGTKGD